MVANVRKGKSEVKTSQKSDEFSQTNCAGHTHCCYGCNNPNRLQGQCHDMLVRICNQKLCKLRENVFDFNLLDFFLYAGLIKFCFKKNSDLILNL